MRSASPQRRNLLALLRYAMSNLRNLLPTIYFVIAVFAVFMAAYRLLAGMWVRGLFMVAAAVFCAYRFHHLRTKSES